MTNQPIPAPAIIDLDAISDAELRILLADSAAILASRIMTLDIPALRDDSFSDDDTDYFPARAQLLSLLIDMLANIDDSLHESLNRSLANDSNDLINALITCDINLPIDSIAPIHALLS